MRRERFVAEAPGPVGGKLSIEHATREGVEAGIARLEPLVDRSTWTVTDREAE